MDDQLAAARGPREPFCAVSHAAGAVAAAVGTAFLLWAGAGSALRESAFAFYGATLILMFLSSAVYHSLRVSEKGTTILQRLDYVSIYLLIAGTYVPVCLLVLPPKSGIPVLAAELTLAAIGVSSTFMLRKTSGVLRMVIYLAMGWMAVTVLPSLRSLMPAAAVWWLVIGGLFFTVGAVIYALERPNLWPGRFSAHDLWHLFVLAGCGCHFVLISHYLVTA